MRKTTKALIAGAAALAFVSGVAVDQAGAQTVSDIIHVDVDGDGTVEWCVGNSTIVDAPYQCEAARDYRVSGVNFRVSVVADFAADGTGTATYFLSRTLPTPVPIRVKAHTGISSTGPLLFDTATDGEDFIAAGQTTATLAFTFTCGQVDIKAVFVGNGNSLGRIMGPYVCSPPPVVPTTTTPTTPPPGQSVPTSAGATSAPTSSSSSGVVGRSLPATGRGGNAAGYAIILLAVGGFAWLVTRKPVDTSEL